MEEFRWKIIKNIFLILINIVFTIYIAKKNSVHYVKVLNNDVLISNDKLLFLGRGYINLLIIGFFSLYTIWIDKFLLKKKITFKSSILIILLSVLILLIGISRVYLGVHYPSDILGGYLLSFALVIKCFDVFEKRKFVWKH